MIPFFYRPFNWPTSNLRGWRISVRRDAPTRPTPDRSQADDRYVRLTPDELEREAPLFVTAGVLAEIRDSIGAQRAEQGGMLGGKRDSGVITHFRFDGEAKRSSATYSPDAAEMNRLLREEWNPDGIDFLGFVHSHPGGVCRPSHGDLVYADRILQAIPALDRMAMPIVQTSLDTGRFELHAHVAARSATKGTYAEHVPLSVLSASAANPYEHDEGFDRVRGAYDLAMLSRTRLVLVGVGGAATFAESMARAGVREFVLIDPDVVDLPNVGTQQVYRRDVGQPKIDAVAKRILDVNPHACVVGVQALLDELSDDAMKRLAHRPLPNSSIGAPHVTFLCGFTDNFWAQARVNRLGLHLGVPTVAAQVYREGRGVELSFSVPGLTHACGRCVLGGRYRAHLERGFTNDVTSHGTPLWATERLNALKAEVVLALAHVVGSGDPAHPAFERHSRLVDAIAQKNLVVARLDQDLATTIGMKTFDKAFAGGDPDRIVTDETLWLPQEPESPDTGFAPCGDCGGTGDLAACKGTFADTRLVAPRRRATNGPRTVTPRKKGRRR